MKKKNKTSLYKIIFGIIIISIVAFSGYYLEKDDEGVPSSDNIVVIDNNVNVGEFPENFSLDNPNLKIFYFDVGQADSSLIIYKGYTMLIDAGNDSNGNLLANYIRELGITKIDYVIGTHNHADHIGGLDKIIDAFDIGDVYMPAVTKTASQKQYMEIITSLNNKNKAIQAVEIGQEFQMDDAKAIVQYVDNNEPDNLNNSSIVIQITLGEQDYLFMGDAEKEVENLASSKNEEERINFGKVDVLKAGHHGSATSNTSKFINIISPEIVIISVGINNTYNHPNDKVLSRLQEAAYYLFRTDKDGTIYIENIDGINHVEKLKTKVQGGE